MSNVNPPLQYLRSHRAESFKEYDDLCLLYDTNDTFFHKGVKVKVMTIVYHRVGEARKALFKLSSGETLTMDAREEE